jgi:hypothetical protein
MIIRVGFCFLSHKAHVRHQLPIALKLAEESGYQVELLVTTNDVYDEIMRVAPNLEQSKCNIQFLKGTTVKTLIGSIKKRSYPNIKNVVKANKRIFLSYDALVTPHSNLNDVMDLDKNRRIKYICTFHGAGDNHIGFDQKFAKYDLLLAPGEDVAARLKAEGIYHHDNHLEIIGYVKFDTVSKTNSKIFDNNNPVILYNPHYMKGLTSWAQFGDAVLEYFAANTQYNLIFAPHLKLFEKGVPSYIADYNQYPNIHVDCESDKLVDCTYTKQADVYLGDGSSQVYEFLYFKKSPVIFLNTSTVQDWKSDPNYLMWHLGCVIQDIKEFDGCIEKQLECPQALLSQQTVAVNNKFHVSGKQPAVLGAEAIKRLFSSDIQP